MPGTTSSRKLPDLLLYNSALFRRHGLPVRSLLVLLHRGADSAAANWFVRTRFPGAPFDVALRYHIVRVWEVPANMAGGRLGVGASRASGRCAAQRFARSHRPDETAD